MGQLNGDNKIVRLSFDFSLHIIAYTEELSSLRKFIIANQVLRSGTAIGASVCEAQNAESLADFIHKMKISAKETGETLYWPGLCKMSADFPPCEQLLEECRQIQRVLSKIISSSKFKLNQPNLPDTSEPGQSKLLNSQIRK